MTLGKMQTWTQLDTYNLSEQVGRYGAVMLLLSFIESNYPLLDKLDNVSQNCLKKTWACTFDWFTGWSVTPHMAFHGFAAVSPVVSQQERPGFDSRIGSFYVEFACPPYVHIGSISSFLPPFEDMDLG